MKTLPGIFSLVTLLLLSLDGSAQQSMPLQALMAKGSPEFREAIRIYVNKLQPKVVGGVKAVAGQFPWQVSIGVADIPDPFYAHFCGGALIGDEWVLTAAHCVEGNDASDLSVFVGTHVLQSGVTRIGINKIYMHSDYKSASTGRDIALLRLKSSVTMNANTRQIDLADNNDEAAILATSNPAIVTGWGATTMGGQGTRTLNYAKVPFVTNERCNKPLAYNEGITADMLCAGKETGGTDSCQGDSGGPLISHAAQGEKLVGVVSWGDGCALPNKVGVYTRVSYYLAWVDACRSGKATCSAITR